MNLIFFGAPGAGKGTIASLLKDNKNIVHISTGDIFRTAIKNKTELGKQVSSILEKGELVPDALTISLVLDRVKEPDCADGYILDGFPRTLVQAKEWSKAAEIDKAVYFDIADDEVVRRLSGRRTCPNCNSIFHIEFNKPEKEGICSNCGTKLVTRPDDAIDAIKNRLDVYHTQTEPLLEYYTDLNKVITLNAMQDLDKVYAEMQEHL